MIPKSMLENKELLFKNKQGFFKLFQVKLDDYFTIYLGFDIVTFDEWLQTTDGISTREFIKEKYGDDAELLVCKLLKM